MDSMVNCPNCVPPVDHPPGELRMIAIENLHESPWNPRQYYPEAPMAELIQSMKESGFRPWLPLVVREAEDGYTIAAGHRRRRAAEAAGIRLIPCMVRHMSDQEFLDILNFDNTGRDDVHPLHEAAGWRTWMEKTGNGVREIAQRIGQSIEYVYQRLKYDNLIDEGKRLFLDGKLTGTHAILIARRPADVQKKALKYMEPLKWDPTKIPSARDLEAWLHNSADKDLNRAPFDQNDATLLAGAGTCAVCPKRAANDPGYRPSLETDDGSDNCTDARCYEQKTTNHLIRIKEELRHSGEEPLEISLSWNTKKKGVLSPERYERLSDTEGAINGKNIKTAVVVEGEEAGKVIRVRVKPEAPRGSKVEKAEQERQQKAHEAEVQTEIEIRRRILRAVCEKVTQPTRADLEALLLAAFDAQENTDELCRLHDIPFEGFRSRFTLQAALPKLKDAELARLVVETAVVSELEVFEASRPAEGLLALAKRYKVDAEKIRKEAAKPSPESAEDPTLPKSPKDAIRKLPALNEAKPKKAKAAPQKKLPAGTRAKIAKGNKERAAHKATQKKQGRK